MILFVENCIGSKYADLCHVNYWLNGEYLVSIFKVEQDEHGCQIWMVGGTSACIAYTCTILLSNWKQYYPLNILFAYKWHSCIADSKMFWPWNIWHYFLCMVTTGAQTKFQHAYIWQKTDNLLLVSIGVVVPDYHRCCTPKTLTGNQNHKCMIEYLLRSWRPHSLYKVLL